MSVINAVLRSVFDAVLYPFRGFPALVGLTALSVVLAICMLLVFKATSNQDAITAIKKKIHACLFEIRLFNDDLAAILRAQIELLGHNVVYLRYALTPMACMFIPIFFMMAQLQFHYGYHPIAPGDEALLKVSLAPGWEDSVPVQNTGDFTKPVTRLEVPDGLTVASPSVWIPTESELDWRIRGDKPGDYQVTVHLGDESFTKDVRVGAERTVQRMSPVRPGHAFLAQLLYPAEPPLPKGAVDEITVTYPSADVWFLGLNLDWVWVLLILSIAFAFALKNRFGVTF